MVDYINSLVGIIMHVPLFKGMQLNVLTQVATLLARIWRKSYSVKGKMLLLSHAVAKYE